MRILSFCIAVACAFFPVSARNLDSDFITLEETVRNNTGEIEELKREIAELKAKLAELLQEGDIGDILFRKGEYEKASKIFIKSYKENKKKDETKAAESLYKLAMCFEHMEEDGESKAKVTYKKLIADYPNSTFAKDAREALKRLNEK